MMRTKWYKIKIFFIFSLFFIGFVILEIKLYRIQYLQYDTLTEEGKGQSFTDYIIKPKRGNIFDRNGRDLAISVDVNSIYATPSKIKNKRIVANKLAIAIEKDRNTIFKCINRERNGEVPVTRQIDDTVTRKVEKLITEVLKEEYIEKGAIRFVKESKRYYPKDELAAHIIGYTRDDENGDNIGAGGLEYYYDKYLRGSLTSIEVKVDGKHDRIYPISEEEFKKSYGNDIYLTIDETIQNIAERELVNCIEEYQAKSGTIIVMNCKTGEVLAMANFPSFNANKSSAPLDFRKIRALTDTYEPGSTMKVLTTSLVLEKGLVQPDELFDGEKGAVNFRIGKYKYRRVVDDHPVEVVEFAEAIALSSNIITIKVASRMSPEDFYNGLKNFGVGELSDIDLPGETRGTLASWTTWQGDSMLSIPIGHEVSFNAIQLCSIISGLVNDGVLMQPHIVSKICDVDDKIIKEFQPTEKARLINKLTSRVLRRLLEGVVEFGTGVKAKVDGYRVGGKTGTAGKWDSETGSYSRSKYLSSFIGFVPVDDPVLTILVWIDEPQGAKYGGTIAAPVFSKVCKDTMVYLGIPPTRDFNEKDVEVLAYNTNSMPSDKDTIKNKQNIAANISEKEKTSEGIAEVSSANEEQGNLMPSLIGLTMKEANDKLIDIGIDYDFKGNGYVVSQEPEPNSIIKENQKCFLVFNF